MTFNLKYVALATFFLTTFASAITTDAPGKYHGGGIWKDSKGAHGRWKATTEVISTKEGKLLNETMTVLNDKGEVVHEEKTASTLKFGPVESFFEVLQAGKAIGTGYCFRHSCHYNYQDAAKGMNGEETIQNIGKGRILRTGSLNEKDGTVIIYTGKQFLHRH